MKKIYLLATIVAIIMGIAVYMFINQITNNSMKSAEDVVGVVVANDVIKQGTVITEEMISLSYLPKPGLAEGYITSTAEVIGKTASCKIGKSEQILSHKVITPGSKENDLLIEKIGQGNRAFTMAVDEISGLAGNLKAGDHVDIIASHTKDGVSTTYMFAENVNILSVGSAFGTEKDTPGYTNITVELPVADCVRLYNESLNGFMTVVLRGLGDDAYIEVPAVIY
ncbi:MAG: Flp pilus assembly protein CpaB [Monoglobales bacterium]